MALSGQLAIQNTLNEALIAFRLRNPSFSLRALARKLDISPAAVSEILNGKRPVTRKVAQKVVMRLGLDPKKSHSLLALFPEKGENKPSGDETPAAPTPSYTKLSMDQFRAIADWYHYAILSLAETEDFNDDPKSIAARLNLRLPDARAAVERLERLGMLRRDTKTGRLIATGEQYMSSDDVMSIALRKSHMQYMEKSTSALDEVDVLLRDFVGVTIAMNMDKLPVAKKMIRKFLGELCSQVEVGAKTEVYRLNLQLIPLTTKESRI